MRRLRIGVFVVALCVAGVAAASSEQDEHLIRDIVAQYVVARNHKDADAVRRLFTPDADQLVSTGEWRRGLEELVRGTSASSSKELGKSSISVESVRFLDSAVAIVDGRYETTSLNGTVRHMRTTLLLKRTPDGWRIAAIRNMLPAPPKAAP